jgi:Domain of unknown function (DUF222)/HNH endonuclease
MESNTYSTGRTDRLRALVAELDGLAAQDPDSLADGALAERILVLRRLIDQLDGHWLGELAAVDARGAAGAEKGVQAASTAGWLRARLRMGPGDAHSAVRTSRALFRGPLPATAQALTAGELSPAHARVLAHGTHDLPDQTVVEAEPVLVDAARRLDPPRLRRAVAHLLEVADPDGAEARAQRRHEQRWLRLAPTFAGMVAVDGLLDAEAGQTLLAALEPLARPTNGEDDRSAGQRNADALAELARRTLESGRLPQTGGDRPQLVVTVDLDTLLGCPGAVGGELGGGELGGLGPLEPEACRRLACDSAITRVLVTRDRGDHDPATPTPGTDELAPAVPGGAEGLAARLRTAMALLPQALGGAPTQPLELGRSTRVVSPTQRVALGVRDQDCVFPGCDRPLSWCEAHHLRHWLHGGPTDLANLALLCRAHHRAVHEGGWRLARHPDGRLTATPPHRRPHTAA